MCRYSSRGRFTIRGKAVLTQVQFLMRKRLEATFRLRASPAVRSMAQVLKISDRKRRHKSGRRSPPPSTHTQLGCGAFTMSSLMSRKPPPASRCRRPLLSSLRGHPPGPHPPSRRPQRRGRGPRRVPTRPPQGCTRPHARGPTTKRTPAALNRHPGPSTPLRRHRVRHQDENGSYQ